MPLQAHEPTNPSNHLSSAGRLCASAVPATRKTNRQTNRFMFPPLFVDSTAVADQRIAQKTRDTAPVTTGNTGDVSPPSTLTRYSPGSSQSPPDRKSTRLNSSHITI